MKKTLIMAALVALVAAMAGFGQTTVAPCSQYSNLSTLLAAGTCFDQDKLYTNFTYDAGAGGPASVNVSIGFVPVGPLDIHTVSFQSAGWTNPFSFAYDVTVTDPNRYISTVRLDATFPVAGGSVTQTNTPAGTVNPLVVSAGSGPATTPHNTQALDVFIQGNPGGGLITQLTSTYEQSVNNPIPEPGTMGLLGAGLLLAGFIGRRARKA